MQISTSVLVDKAARGHRILSDTTVEVRRRHLQRCTDGLLDIQTNIRNVETKEKVEPTLRHSGHVHIDPDPAPPVSQQCFLNRRPGLPSQSPDGAAGRVLQRETNLAAPSDEDRHVLTEVPTQVEGTFQTVISSNLK